MRLRFFLSGDIMLVGIYSLKSWPHGFGGDMAYDQALAERIRGILSDIPHLQEKKMFGGVGYLIQGNMACGVNGNNLIVRVGPERTQEALAKAHTKLFDMTGRPMTGWIVVEPEGISQETELERWVAQGVEFTQTLPAK